MRHSHSHRTRALRAAIPLALLLLYGCSGPVFDPAGDIAREQRDIILFSTALMLLIIVPVIILIIVFAWRYRKGRGATYDPAFDHSTPLELAIWSAPLVIIIALGALTWSSTHLLDPFRPLTGASPSAGPGAAAAQQAPLVIQVVSLDWKWLFIYPEQGVATVNELALPIDRPVRFDITSSNMMNTFYAPTLAGMIYAMPGMQSQMHAILRRVGDFDGYSANYSGAGFSDMHFRLKGVDADGFARWIGAARSAGRSLTLEDYRALAKPSERVPVIRFAHVDGDLYRRILERCVDAGAMCTGDMMQHDRMSSRMTAPAHAAMPADAAEAHPAPMAGH
jgi:cytochrome o ubiquinol oxidase subunit 2